tara:strand:- start:171 stop:887 length:717 start_codon:yes stop_codon:yes gene_type:complete
MQDNISILLQETSHPGNIGSAARAMKTMMLKHLMLIQPRVLPDAEAEAFASGAADILNNAIIKPNINDALSEFQVVFGCSARHRKLEWPMLSLHEAAQVIVEKSKTNKVGILFGPEQSGLTNDTLRKCHYHLYIPSNPEYSSLNLAQAVQVVSYAVLMAQDTQPQLPIPNPEPRAKMQEFESFFEAFQQMLMQLEFMQDRENAKLLARLRRMFYRAEMHSTEIDLMRGIIKSIGKKLS